VLITCAGTVVTAVVGVICVNETGTAGWGICKNILCLIVDNLQSILLKITRHLI